MKIFQSWYQDEFGVLHQEETEEDFYSDDELNQHEAALRREQTEVSSKPSKAVELNKSVIERSKSSDKPTTKLETPQPVSTNLSTKPVEVAPAPAPAPASVQDETQKPSKPAEVAESQGAKEPAVKEPRSLESGSRAKERWVWAYTKILQVGQQSDVVSHVRPGLSISMSSTVKTELLRQQSWHKEKWRSIILMP